MDNTGFVYLMAKESSPGYLKIGRTEKKPHLRAIELDGTDSPTPSIVIYYAYCENDSLLEKATHSKLVSKRVRMNREWFACSRSEAITAIKAVAENLNIKIYYEEFFGDVINDDEEVLHEEYSANDTESLIDEETIVKNCIDLIFSTYERSCEEKIKYKNYFDNHEKELLARKNNGEEGTESMRSLGFLAYSGKVSEINDEMNRSISQIIKNNEAYLDDEIITKIIHISKRIKSGELKKTKTKAIKNNENLIGIIDRYTKG